MTPSMPRFLVGLVQFTPKPRDVQANLTRIDCTITGLARKGVELVILPELWSTGPLSPRDKALAHKTPSLLGHLQSLAHANGITLVGSLPELSEDRLYNTAYVVGPEGVVGSYRKIHLFAPFGEEGLFTPGGSASPVWTLVSHKEIGLGPLICFDLRFPEICRHLVWQGAQLLVVSALWPKSRRAHFDLLLQARAVENQCFIAAANAWGQVGPISFGGGSCVIDPTGEVLGSASDSEDNVVLTIDLETLSTTRKIFSTARSLQGWLSPSDLKLLDLPSLVVLSRRRRAAGQRLVFTNGCFDLLHAGHVAYLESARRRGDFLVVGVNSDSSVRSLKGSERPITPEGMRAQVLAGLGCVDYVVVFEDLTPIHLIETLRPDVLVKGADWSEEEIVGSDAVRSWGGEVVCIPLVSDLSTTCIVGRIRSISSPSNSSKD